MSKFLTPRTTRVAAGLAVLSAFAAAPAAHAATTTATGTLTGGSLSNTAPSVTAFSATLTGVNQTVNTPVGAWSVNDASGTNAGYTVTVSATAPTVAGSAAKAGTDGSLELTTTTAAAAGGNSAVTGPGTAAPQLLTTTAATIATAAADTGQGQWNFPAAGDLEVVIPGDASAGAYSSTLTYTAAQPVV